MSKFRLSGTVLFFLLAMVLGGVATTLVFRSQDLTQPEPRPSVSPQVAQAEEASTGEVVGSQIFVKLAKRSVPSVVNISTSKMVKRRSFRGQPDHFRDFFEKFFGQPMPQSPWGPNEGGGEGEGQGALRPNALGTGFIIDSTGLILTNNHVIQGADEIKIHFTQDETETPTDGELVGRDEELDLALIKVKTDRKLVPLALGNSDALQVGEYIMAVGNPFGQGHTVTHGIVSAKGRVAPQFSLATYIQVDAPINPGNSGGPLINLKGEVVGINNAIDARAQGIGFAIPINLVKNVLPQLKSKGAVERGYLGVVVNPLTPDTAGNLNLPKDLKAPMVVHVYPDQPAGKAGVEPYDVIVKVADKAVRSPRELIQAVTAFGVGQTIKVTVNRKGKEKVLKVKLTKRPGSQTLAKSAVPKKGSKGGFTKRTGMQVSDLTSQLAQSLGLPKAEKGVVITNLEYDGPAAQAGFARGDLLLEVDTKRVRGRKDLESKLKASKSYLVRVKRITPRGGERYSVLVLDLKKK